jgi:hypothetical protein
LALVAAEDTRANASPFPAGDEDGAPARGALIRRLGASGVRSADWFEAWTWIARVDPASLAGPVATATVPARAPCSGVAGKGASLDFADGGTGDGVPGEGACFDSRGMETVLARSTRLGW